MEDGTENIFTCDACRYTFAANKNTEQCPDCGKFAVRGASAEEIENYRKIQIEIAHTLGSDPMKSGLQQRLQVAHIELSPQTKKELDERFVLIYTGQRRLARNLLRDVVGRYVGNEPDSLFALEEIQKTAALMRFELERGNVDGFAKLLDYHWELSKKIDAGSSNTLIEQIFSSIEELVDGKLVCGAGGGGFLQVILKKGVTRQMVEERLKEVFMDSLVGVADCNLVWE